MKMSWFSNDYPLHIGSDWITHIIIYNPDGTRVCIVEWAAACTEEEKQKWKGIETEVCLSSVWCTSRCRSSAPVRLPRPAGCGCVSAAGADSEPGHQIPSLPARPSWRHEMRHLLEATCQGRTFIYVLAFVFKSRKKNRFPQVTFSEPVCPVNKAL